MCSSLSSNCIVLPVGPLLVGDKSKNITGADLRKIGPELVIATVLQQVRMDSQGKSSPIHQLFARIFELQHEAFLSIDDDNEQIIEIVRKAVFESFSQGECVAEATCRELLNEFTLKLNSRPDAERRYSELLDKIAEAIDEFNQRQFKRGN